MLNDDLKTFIKRYSFLWNILRFLKTSLAVSLRLKDVFMMMLLFQLWPKQTYRFSTRKYLPSKKNRYRRKTALSIPYDLLKSKSSNISLMDEINVICFGSSFNLNNIKNFDKQTFVVCAHSSAQPLRISEDGSIIYIYEKFDIRRTIEDEKKIKNSKIYRNSKITYLVNDPEAIKKFRNEGHSVLGIENYVVDEHEKYFPLRDYWEKPSYLNLFNNENCKHISTVEKIYYPPLSTQYSNSAPVGAPIPYLSALSFYAKKINVYGWDFYLESSPNNMNYWQLFSNMYKFKYDVRRSRNHFESALINFYYGYKFSNLPNFKIHSYLGQLKNHEKLIKKIEKVLFE